jgi:hypothetical protein
MSNDDIWGAIPLENFFTDDEIMEIERRYDENGNSKESNVK